MRALLGDAGRDFRRPPPGQLLQGADIEVAVVEELLELRHVAGEESPILADAVAAHRRGARGDQRGQELERARLRLRHADAARPHPRHEPRGAVLALVPVVHPRQRLIGLVNGHHGPLGEDAELLVGDDGGDLDDRVRVGLETRHLEIDPDQILCARHTVSVATFDARVIAAFGRHLLVQEASGRTIKARPFGRDLGAVCGDEVRCRNDPHHGEVHVVEVLPRRTTLYRSNARGGIEPVLANITRLLVVIAPLPPPDPFVADRYLAAAESAGIAATPVLNKAELGLDEALRRQLEVYAAAGYPCITLSAATGEGVDLLLAACAGQVAALVGQSGVGKSSLVRRLAPDAEVEIGRSAYSMRAQRI